MKTPLMAYGFDSTSMEYFKSKLPQYNYETYDTASSSSDDIAKPLEAGGSVAALLVDGDLNSVLLVPLPMLMANKWWPSGIRS